MARVKKAEVVKGFPANFQRYVRPKGGFTAYKNKIKYNPKTTFSAEKCNFLTDNGKMRVTKSSMRRLKRVLNYRLKD